jgi:flagellar biogenesis protein FliO
VIDNPGLILLVLAAFAAVPVVLRRHKANTPDAVRVVGRTALNKTAVVAVVAVGDRRILVGAGDRGVQLLTELDQAGDVVPDPTTTTTASTSFPLDRTDVAELTTPRGFPTVAQDALTGLDLTGQVAPAGPRTGLVDRLRAMTVRTPVPGRPSYAQLLRR